MASPKKRSRDDEGGEISDLVDLRDQLREFAVQREWDQFHTPRNLALALVGEIGELCEIFQWKGDAGAAPGLALFTAAQKEHLGEELADCLMYIIRLADKCDINLPRACRDKIRKNAAKYPADRVRGSSKKYNEYKEFGSSADGGSSV